MSTPLRTRRLSYALGAEIIGVDLSQPVDARTFAQIRSIWVENLIVLFRGQHGFTPERHLEFSRQFGKVDPNESSPEYRVAGHTEIIEITNKPRADNTPSPTAEAGRRWHSDLEFTLQPTMASLLWCGQRPDVGGDTMFASKYLAYDALSPGVKTALEGLNIVYPVPKALTDLGTPYGLVAQPAVQVHPESGRKALCVSQRASHFEGWTPAESRGLLDYLNTHATQPEFVYRHQWATGDLVIWDNRCTLHQALGDYDRRQIRYMRRTAVQGLPSGHVVQA